MPAGGRYHDNCDLGVGGLLQDEGGLPFSFYSLNGLTFCNVPESAIYS